MPGDLELGRWLAIVLLAIVASGWRPRVTGLLHWWLSWSIFGTLSAGDGGDQAAAMLTLFLVPVTLVDGRRWHWDDTRTSVGPVRNVVAHIGLAAARFQVAIIYFHAATAKMSHEQWRDGTALYYWIVDPMFGSPDWLLTVLGPILKNPGLMPLLTWSVILLEYVLSLGPLLRPPIQRVAFMGGVLFHAGIIVVHGISSFAVVMFGALILLLYPLDEPFRMLRKSRNLARMVRIRVLGILPERRERLYAGRTS